MLWTVEKKMFCTEIKMTGDNIHAIKAAENEKSLIHTKENEF